MNKGAFAALIFAFLISCSANYTLIKEEINPAYDKEMNYEANKVSILTESQTDAVAIGIPIGEMDYAISSVTTYSKWRIYKGRKEIEEYDLALLAYGKEEAEKVRRAYKKFRNNKIYVYSSACLSGVIIGIPFLVHSLRIAKRTLPVTTGSAYYYYTLEQTIHMARMHNEKLRKRIGIQQ